MIESLCYATNCTKPGITYVVRVHSSFTIKQEETIGIQWM